MPPLSPELFTIKDKSLRIKTALQRSNWKRGCRQGYIQHRASRKELLKHVLRTTFVQIAFSPFQKAPMESKRSHVGGKDEYEVTVQAMLWQRSSVTGPVQRPATLTSSRAARAAAGLLAGRYSAS